jgi:hypothetical protein
MKISDIVFIIYMFTGMTMIVIMYFGIIRGKSK